MTNVLLLGLQGTVVHDAVQQLGLADVQIFGGTGLQDLHRAFDAAPIDVVIMGAGIELESRLELVRAVFQRSERATVHMKDAATGPQGFLPFIRQVLVGLRS